MSATIARRSRLAEIVLSAVFALLLVSVIPADSAQFAGGGGSTGITLSVADWVPARDKEYGGWGVVAAGGSIETPLQWTKDAPTLTLPPGTYDVYWVQNYDGRDRPILLATNVKVETGLIRVDADTGIKLEVAAFVPPRDKEYGWWAAFEAGAKPNGKPVNAAKTDNALLLPPGNYDIYWVQDYDTRETPMLLASTVSVGPHQVVTVNADSGVKLEIASFVPARDKDYGWWGAVRSGDKPNKRVNWTKTANALLLPPADYDIYWVQDYDTRDAPMLLAHGFHVQAGEIATLRANTGVQIEVAAFVPPRDKEYGWWGAVSSGDKPNKRVNWTKTANALLLPPDTYDIYWVQDYDVRDRPLLLAANVAVTPGRPATLKANTGIRIEVADWVPPRDKEYGWWGVLKAGDQPPGSLVNWTKTVDALLLPPGDYDVYWVQNYATRNRPLLVRSGVTVSPESWGIGVDFALTGYDVTVVRTVKDGPADRVGIRAGDIIAAADGLTLTRASLPEVIARLRNATASSVKLTVKRDGRTQEITTSYGTIAKMTTVGIASGLRPIVDADVPTLDGQTGMWGAAPAWEGPDAIVNFSQGKADPIVLPPGRYDIYWQPDGSSQPLLKARGVLVVDGQLANAQISSQTLAAKISVVTGFDVAADNALPLVRGAFPAGAKQIVATFRWKNATIGRRLGVRWYKDDSIVLEQGEPVATADGETGWTLKTGDSGALPVGNYRVDLMEDGDLRASTDFAIVDKKADSAAAPASPAPAQQATSAPTQQSGADANPSTTGTTKPGAGTGGEWALVQTLTEGSAPTANDDFSDLKSGWTTVQDSDEQVGYIDGSYHIALEVVGGGWALGSNEKPIGDGVLSIDVSDAPDSIGHPFGVFVRGQDGQNFHAFVISADESFASFHVEKGVFAMDGPPNKRLAAGLYRHDGPNRMTVFLQGNTIVYFLNNQEVDRATALWPSGRAGVVSANIKPGWSDVAFDNWKVWAAAAAN